MNILEAVREAERLLGVESGADARTVRRAYRRAVREAPPDRDSEAFLQVRRAYERLTSTDWIGDALQQPYPYGPVPELAPPPPVTFEAVAAALLRHGLGAISVAELSRAAGEETRR